MPDGGVLTEALRYVADHREARDILAAGRFGCHKTMPLQVLAGFDRPSRGRVLPDGRDITEAPLRDLPVHMMVQSKATFPHMTVKANVGSALNQKVIAQALRAKRVHAGVRGPRTAEPQP